ncbi:MAG TPA: hypothetical protein VIO14_04475, partial [Dehalococcoidia bacterium]
TVGNPSMALSQPGNHAFVLAPGQRGPDRAVEVRNTGTGLLSWAATSNRGWLKLIANSGLSLGSDQGSQSSSFTFYVDATGLSPGTYQGTITITASSAGGSPQTINVTLVVADPVRQGSVPGTAR